MNNVKNFLNWIRNGTSFLVTWFVFLIIVFGYIFDIDSLKIETLFKIFILSFGAVFIFTLLFSKVIIKKINFSVRLTIFMVLIAIYQFVGFYWIGLFVDNVNIGQLVIFLSTILISYFISMGIYSVYSKKCSDVYTNALHKYQQQRKVN